MIERQKPEGSMVKGWLAAGVTLAGILGAAYLYMNSEEETKSEPIQVSDVEKKKKKEEWKEMCDFLSGERDDLKKRYFNRRGILESLSRLGSCTDPDTTEFNFPAVCKAISEGIQKTGPIKNPILRPFYEMLYDELKCKEKSVPQNHKAALDELVKVLESTDLIKNYRLLNPENRIDDICKEGEAFIRNEQNRDSIRTIRDYLFEKSVSLPNDSAIKDMITRSRAVYKEAHGREPSDEDLKQEFEMRLSILTAMAAVRSLCLVSPVTIINNFKLKMTEEDLTQKRRLLLPAVREALNIVKDEQDEQKSRAVTAALLTLARNMNKQK